LLGGYDPWCAIGVRVRFYFDFISPYSYLATRVILQRRELSAIDFDYRPVVFGSMLSKLGTMGPGEVPAKRRYGLEDVLMLAEKYGVPLEGPPAHPFNSIYALRSICALGDEKQRGRLTQRYFDAAWAEGRSLEDLSVLRACLKDVGIEQDPEEAASAPENRKALKTYTQELLDAGGFGVPSFIAKDRLFWGHDRLDLLRAFLEGDVALDGDKLERLLRRPQPGRIV
jgi:2-hydroxychromene-2-carboxylate isomerase